MTGPAIAGHSISVTIGAADPEPLVGRHDSPVALHSPPPVPAFEDVYDEYFAFVWRCLRRLGVQAPALDDAVQDVFVVVHRRLGEFEQRSSLKTWLFGIAFRVAGAHRRALQRRGEAEPVPAELADGAPGPLEVLERREGLRILDALLARLDEEKRAVFIMAEIEEMTAPEIAEALGIPVNTAYSRLHAARRMLEAMAARDPGATR